MSEQPNPAPGVELGAVLASARHLELAQAALGGATILPDDVRAVLGQGDMQRPEGATWQGSPIWLTAYYAGLREHVLAQRAARRGEAPDAAALAARQQRVTRVVARVETANQVVLSPPDSLPSAAWADAEGPRADFQNRYGNILRWAAVMPPTDREPLPVGTAPLMPDTIVLPAPTGVGKTLLGGNYLAAAGVGRQNEQGRRRRAVWVTINQQLVADLLNEEKTLQKTLPDGTTMTAIWQDHKEESDASGDVVGVTIQSIEDALTAIEEGREPLINPADFDIMVFDEAHEALSARMTAILQRFDCQKVLLTATPTRSNWISLLNRYHHIPPMGRREAIEEGLLSPVHIVSIMAESMVHAEHQAALAAVDFFIKHGKKAFVYCQPGGGNAQAVRIATLIKVYAEQTMGDQYDSNLVYAEMIGTANPNSLESIYAFEGQSHGGARTTTQMGGVGYDYPELDGGIWVGPQGDPLALEQESGRPLRPKADGRAAWWVQIFTPLAEGAPLSYTLAQMVGLEAFPDPGQAIGRTSRPGAGSGQPPPGPPGSLPGESPGTGGAAPERANGAGAPPGPAGGTGAAESTPGTGSPSASDILAGVSAELVNALITPQTPLAEVVIEPNRRANYIPPPEYSVTDEMLAERFNVPVSFIHYHFEPRNGVPNVTYKSIRTMRLPGAADSDPRMYIRHYHAVEVEARLRTHPVPRVSDTIYGVAAMADMLHAPANMVEDAIRELRLPDRPPTRAAQAAGHRGARPVARYTLAEFTQISEWVDRLPVADPQDQPWRLVAQQYPLGAKTIDSEAERTRLRHPLTSDRRGTEYFVRADVVRRVAAEDARRRKLVHIKAVTERVGVGRTALLAGLNEEQRAFVADPANQFAPAGGTKNSAHLTEEMVAELAERIGPKPLQYNEVTYEAVRQRVRSNVGASTLRAVINPYRVSAEPRRVVPHSYPVVVYSIEAVREAERAFGAVSGAPAINYGRFEAEAGAAAPSEDLAEYARTVQVDVLGISLAAVLPAPEAGPAPTAEPAAPVVQAPPAAEQQAEPEPAPAPEPPAAPDVKVVPLDEVAAAPASPATPPPPRPAPTAPPVPAVEFKPPATPPPAPAASAEPERLPEPPPGHVGLQYLVDQSGRTAGAVANAVRQLGLEDDLARNAVRQEDAYQILALLGGGRRAGHTAAAASPAPASAPVRPAPKAEPAPAAPARNPDEWKDAAEAAARLKCSPAALVWLVDSAARKKDLAAIGEYRAVGEVHVTLLAQLARDGRLRTARFTESGWMAHATLAQNIGVPEDQLLQFIAEHGIRINAAHYKIVRRPRGSAVEFDVVYAEFLWKRVMAAAPKKGS